MLPATVAAAAALVLFSCAQLASSGRRRRSRRWLRCGSLREDYARRRAPAGTRSASAAPPRTGRRAPRRRTRARPGHSGQRPRSPRPPTPRRPDRLARSRSASAAQTSAMTGADVIRGRALGDLAAGEDQLTPQVRQPRLLRLARRAGLPAPPQWLLLGRPARREQARAWAGWPGAVHEQPGAEFGQASVGERGGRGVGIPARRPRRSPRRDGARPASR